MDVTAASFTKCDKSEREIPLPRRSRRMTHFSRPFQFLPRRGRSASIRIKDERRLSVRLRDDLEPAAADSGRRICEPVFLLSWVLITAKVTQASLV